MSARRRSNDVLSGTLDGGERYWLIFGLRLLIICSRMKCLIV